MASREVPADPHGHLLQSTTPSYQTGITENDESAANHLRRNQRVRNARRPHPEPETALQAVMEAPPNNEPERSKEEHERDASAYADVVDRALRSLTATQRHIVQASVIERKPLVQIAKQMHMSKSSAWRIKNEALAALRSALAEHPAIVAYLTTDESDPLSLRADAAPDPEPPHGDES